MCTQIQCEIMNRLNLTCFSLHHYMTHVKSCWGDRYTGNVQCKMKRSNKNHLMSFTITLKAAIERKRAMWHYAGSSSMGPPFSFQSRLIPMQPEKKPTLENNHLFYHQTVKSVNWTKFTHVFKLKSTFQAELEFIFW